MQKRSFEAPEYVGVNGPLIFLAGPIQGAPDWQAQASEIILSLHPSLYIASPRRHIPWRGGDFTAEMYNEQVDWETTYLNYAARFGSILFWLAKEQDHTCRRAYAQTTRFELAEWKERHLETKRGAGLVIGIEDGFTGARYITRRLGQECPDLKIHDNLEATCAEAVRTATSR